MKCPHCNTELTPEEVAKMLGKLGGRSTSEAKQKAARENGKKGGRPKKQQDKTPQQ